MARARSNRALAVPIERILALLAELLSAALSRCVSTEGDQENRHALHDVGAAVSNLSTQALALDLFVHQMAGFDVEKARSDFGIPDGYEPVATIAIGYLGDPQTLPESLREQELASRTRKPFNEFIFSGRWNQPSDLAID